MSIGLYDIKDKLWLGNDKGPLLYDDPVFAESAAEIAAKQLGFCLLRIRPRPWTDDKWKYKDTLNTVMSGEAAVKHLEEGGI